MTLLFCILFLLFSGGVASLALNRTDHARVVAGGSCLLACVAGFAFSLHVLLTGKTVSAFLPIPLPLGQCFLSVDTVSAVFLLPVFLISGLSGLLLASEPKNEHYDPHLQASQGFFFCMLIAGMVLVLTAADSVFFLISWEAMSLMPFFLLFSRTREQDQRYAGWIYLVAAHLGVLPLLFLFAAMSTEAGGTAFSVLTTFDNWHTAGLLFVLALVGFGVKIGLFPLHVWMPKAYPAASAPVAAVLSGAMVNVGVYGIIRVLLLLAQPADWWAYLLMGVGAASGVLGVLFALAQPDIKRALAYSSAENMGIICLALGAGLLAVQKNATLVAVLFFSGALLHMWNHSLFKSLSFLGAGAVRHMTGTTEINRLGGLQKRMPFTGNCLAVASASLAGTPPFNGFVGELLMYLGFVAGALATRGTEAALFFWGGLFALGSIAGLSLLCFSRLYGLSFLGAPRDAALPQGTAVPAMWKIVMATMATLCLAASLAAPLLFHSLQHALPDILQPLANGTLVLEQSIFDSISQTLEYVTMGSLLLFAVIGILALYRNRCLARNESTQGITWDCGYLFPSARMQYTGGAFAQFPAQATRIFLRHTLETPRLDLANTPFPPSASARFEAPDWATALWSKYLFHAIARVAAKGKFLQGGLLNVYILYILIALLAALAWTLGWS